MPAGCKALNSVQLVAGCDVHKQMPPPPPAGPVPAPHVVVYCMGFAMPSTAKQSTTVKAGWGYALGRQHDLGMGIYHFAANVLLPVIWAGAGNKAEFGASKVRVAVQEKSLPMAVALIPRIGLNLQLDCNEPCPMPTSTCVASFNTVEVGFSRADCLAGFAAMLADVAVTWASSKIVGGAFKLAGAGMTKVLGKSVRGIQTMLTAGLVAAAFPTTAEYIGSVSNLVVGWVVGSPLGYSPDFAPGGGYGGKLNEAINDSIAPAPTSSSTPPNGPTTTDSRLRGRR